MIILSIETTGLHDRPPGWDPKVVAIGTARVEGRKVTASGSTLVWQPADHVFHDAAAKAFEINGIVREDVVMPEVQSEGDVAYLIRQLLDLENGQWTAFNVNWAQRFLCAPPWQLPPPWGCLMERSAALIGMEAKGRPRKRVSMKQALAWANVAEPPSDLVETSASRVKYKAIKLAQLYIAMRSEPVS